MSADYIRTVHDLIYYADGKLTLSVLLPPPPLASNVITHTVLFVSWKLARAWQDYKEYSSAWLTYELLIFSAAGSSLAHQVRYMQLAPDGTESGIWKGGAYLISGPIFASLEENDEK